MLCIYSAGAEQPRPAALLKIQPNVVFRRLPDGVESWAVKTQALATLPAFYRAIENLADVVFGKQTLPFRRTVVFLVGIPEYPSLSPSLPFVRNDLEDLRTYFLNQGGADEVYVASGKTATAALVESYMVNVFRKRLAPNDRLIFYFAGHGIDGGGTTGYIQLYNARPDDLATDVLRISDVREWSRLIAAKHVLFLFDSCSSGLGVTSRATLGDQRQQIINTLSNRGSRTVITAGLGNQKTFEIRSAKDANRGNGVFTRAFLDALSNNRGEGFLTINEVFADLERRVAYFASSNNQSVSPKLWTLDEDEFPGTFIFLNSNAEAVKKSMHDYRPYLNIKSQSKDIQQSDISLEVLRAQNFREQGILALQRGNLAAASSHLGKAFEIRSRFAPLSLLVAESLADLGKVALNEGAIGQAMMYFQKSLQIAWRNAPEGQHSAEALNGLGLAYLQRGELDTAELTFKKALTIFTSIAPRSLDCAEVQQHLGKIALRKGNLKEAEEYFSRALAVVEEQASRSRLETELHENNFELFSTMNRAGQMFREAEAATLSFESEFSRAGGSLIDRATFRRRQHDFTLSYIGQLAGNDQTSLAFSLLGESRGRILAEAILDKTSQTVPSARTLRKEVLSDSLEPDTAIVAYSVMEDKILIQVHTELRSSAKFVSCPRNRLNALIDALRQAHSSNRPAPRNARGQELYNLLIRPVEEIIKDSKRLAIISDGPLDFLPFSLLMRGATSPSERPGYLVEWKPYFRITSLYVWSRLKEREEIGAYPVSLLAFAPAYECGAGNDAESSNVLYFPNLPWAKVEARMISSFFSGSQLHLGHHATKEAFMAHAPDSRYIHIGGHGITDYVNPLGSKLVFSTEHCERPEKGMLSAAEIIERLNLKADLVTLANCQTGLGVSVPAEGIMGLTWAFLAAGSRSVMASMWNVDDAATSELMRNFYSRLKNGESKMESLSGAQKLMMRDPRFSSPHYWAGFELYGDWR